MKIDKISKTLFILLILSLSSVQTNCRKAKLSRKLLKSKNKVKSATKDLGFIWTILRIK